MESLGTVPTTFDQPCRLKGRELENLLGSSWYRRQLAADSENEPCAGSLTPTHLILKRYHLAHRDEPELSSVDQTPEGQRNDRWDGQWHLRC